MVAGRQSAAVSCGALALVALALIIPGATAFGFSNVPVGGVACRAGALASTCEARRPAMRAALRMGREDGGADKISRPGTGGGVGNKPVQGAGDGGAGERESGGAGVAVLTKPPDVDKVRTCLWTASPAVPTGSMHASAGRSCCIRVAFPASPGTFCARPCGTHGAA